MMTRMVVGFCSVWSLSHAAVLLLIACIAGSADATPLDDRVSFNDDIRPILAANCYVCHGFDPSTRKANLRLDIRAGAITPRGDAAAVVPGQPDASLLLARISSHDPLEQMPPEGREQLTAQQIKLLRRWIAQGAQYDQHWSFKPLLDPPVPPVADVAWPRDDVDRFILARLEQRNISPAQQANRRTLIRRAFFDIIGLPPTPEQVERFVNDDSPDAWVHVVDELLASPHFGERWGRHWLDLMRYAETHGHEFDYPIHHAWQYRDYVIRAFNADVPYDDFVREHIAGDLLGAPRKHPTEQYNESLIATGWWWLSQGTHGPVDVRADEAERIDNQIDVLSRTFLGLTVSCARCHDHKFDPITQRDYYALSGFLQSSRRAVAYLDPGERIEQTLDDLAHARGITQSVMDSQSDSLAIPSKEHYLARLTAALQVINGHPRPGDPPIAPEFVIFDDFEDGNYDGWTIEGSAFGEQPYTQDTLGEHQGDVGAHRAGFVNSHNSRAGKGSAEADQHTGRLISDKFTIDHKYIHFLIGGGSHKGRTCLNLVIDGHVVSTAEGRNNNTMRRAYWDVSESIGRQAHLEIIDQETGGWGHIGIDHITFSDSPSWREETTRPIATVARESDLDEAELANWVDAVRDERFAWLRSTRSVQHIATHRREVEQIPFTTSNGMPDGFAFAKQVGRLPGTLHVTSGLIANSGSIAPRLRGTWRSPTFELTRPYLHYALMGRGTVRLIIDSYYLDEYNPLLFEGMKFDVNTPNRHAWQMHTQPILEKYIGHRAYIEIIDDSDDWIAVNGLWLSDHPDAPLLVERIEPLSLERIADELHRVSASLLPMEIEDRLLTYHNWLCDHRLVSRGFDAAMLQALATEQSIAAAIPEPVRVLAMTDGTPEEEYIFVRGDHNHLGDIAHRRFLGVLSGDQQATIVEGSGRLELANRLLDDSNPLPARVMANRVWQHLFGVPLVPTPDDFGALGTAPTHPNLLDHLAVWFRDDAAWSVKALIRRLMLTHSYQMASTSDNAAAALGDPTNALLHRMNVKRLEGEAIRDAALYVSGRFDPLMYGPPVNIHLTAFMQGRGRPGRSGPLDGNGRRSIYTAVRRNFLSPMMLAFDTPVPHSTVGKRNVSNVPAQSLMLMNDPFIAEQASLWATRMLNLNNMTTAERIKHLYVQAFSRPPTAFEQQMAAGFLDLPVDAPPEERHAAWQALCHVMFNVKEFIFIH